MPRKATDSGSKAGQWGDLAKWGVIGVVVITFMVLFQDQLKGLLSRTEELSVTTEGVKLKVRTVSTPLGETVLSDKAGPLGAAPAPPSAAAPAPGDVGAGGPISPAPLEPSFTQWIDPVYGYSISWPAGGEWIKDDALAQQIGASMVIRYYQSLGNATPNVNVTIENTGPMPVRQWMQIALPYLQSMGWILADMQMDEVANAGVRVLRNPNVPGGLYQIQRVILKNGLAYVVTASKLEADSGIFPGMYQSMGNILNSFSAP